jgi:hypothetical protein
MYICNRILKKCDRFTIAFKLNVLTSLIDRQIRGNFGYLDWGVLLVTCKRGPLGRLKMGGKKLFSCTFFKIEGGSRLKSGVGLCKDRGQKHMKRLLTPVHVQNNRYFHFECHA